MNAYLQIKKYFPIINDASKIKFLHSKDAAKVLKHLAQGGSTLGKYLYADYI
jgi:hypothetical protein